MTSKEEIEYYLFEDGTVSGSRYAGREKYWENLGLSRSGYYPDISQVHLGVKLIKGCEKSFEKTMETLQMILPHLKKNSEGNKTLGVFEHTLSEYGSYTIEVNGLGFFLNVWVYGTKRPVESFKSLGELVKYVQEHHYYDEIGEE